MKKKLQHCKFVFLLKLNLLEKIKKRLKIICIFKYKTIRYFYLIKPNKESQILMQSINFKKSKSIIVFQKNFLYIIYL